MNTLLHLDIGGFGLEADFTTSTSLGTQYKMNDNWTLDLRYKAIWVDYKDGSKGNPGYFAYDTVTHGPLIGFIDSF